MSSAIKRAWVAAQDVSEREIEQHVPTVAAIQIAEALLAGHCTGLEIADFLGHTPATVWAVLREPREAAWISHTINKHIAHRLGMVTAAVYSRACTGDTQSARLIYERFGELVSKSEVKHSHTLELGKLSDAELDTVLRSKLLGNPVIEAEAVVIDVKPDVKSD